jgi:hypothetical protein
MSTRMGEILGKTDKEHLDLAVQSYLGGMEKQ